MRARGTTSFHDERISTKAFDRRLLSRLFRYALPYRVPMAVALLLIILVSGLGLAGPFIVRAAIDGPLRQAIRGGATPSPESPVSSLLALAGIYLAVSIALLGLRFAQVFIMAWIGQRVMLDLRKQLFSHLIRMPFAFFDKNPIGRLVTRITSDVEALNELFASGFVSLIADVLVLVGITAALLVVNVRLALVTLVVVPLLALATFVFRALARRYYREQRRHLSHLSGFTQEAIQGMGIIQVFHREKHHQRLYQAINEKYRTAFLHSVLCYSAYFPIVEFLGTAALAAVIWQATTLLSSAPPELSLGEFFLFWYFLGRFFQPIRNMAERYNVLQAAMAAAERVFKVLDTPEGLVDPDEPRPLSSIRGKVEFDHVWFAYDGEEWVLRDVSFRVEPGQTVAIVGATGAGKSTIIQLMSRFWDAQRGTIRIDGIDVREFSKRALRRRIGIVLQDVFLFSRSIHDNIALDDPTIDRSVVEAATRRVHADRFVERSAKRWDLVLEERGRTLSVGERQLLAFARALAHDPDFLILDEATAHVDSETELLIQEALAELLQDRTSIVIAHRLSTIRRADRIIVLHKGEVRESGTHAELLARGGIYHCLHELQYRRTAGRPRATGGLRDDGNASPGP